MYHVVGAVSAIAFVLFFFLGKPILAACALVLLGRAVAPWIAHHIGMMSQGLYNPNHNVDHHITPIYGEAQTAKNRGNYRQAIEIYKGIAEDFPEETKPHVEMIEIARHCLRDEKLAEEIYTRALHKIHTPIKQEHIKRFYEENR